MTAKPVVFLAFANDRERRARYLRNLPEEARRLRAKLEAAQRAGLCELLVRQNVTREELFAVFQSAEYRDRVALFHYGGHANGYALLLEETSGGVKTAHAAGLAELLGAQRGLRFVFLNGCATEGQAQGLLDAGVAAVLATSQAIDDEVALDFAGHFYAGLGNGASLERAYAEAKAAVATGSAAPGEAAPDLYRPDIQTPPERWPWQLHIKEGAERVLVWSLPQAAGDPLFGLPALPRLDLPKSPFRHLDWFEDEHAEVFFGRVFQIRELYDWITTADAPPILLFYGQTGVGKSSVLAAGLLPRLESSHRIHYLRRDPSLGLLGTLWQALEPDAATPYEAWQATEGSDGPPLLIVLDQVEEVFTRPSTKRPEELAVLVDGLRSIFGKPPDARPHGRLILSLRKEWLPEIEDSLHDNSLPHAKLFLRTLDRRGIVAAVEGCTRSERLRTFYKLQVDDHLAEEIAHDLLADPESPVAPTLQILLSKLWIEAKRLDDAHPRFTHDLYLRFKRDGILLTDFLDQQLTAVEQWRSEVVQSGLALDLLAFHTTPKGTAEQRLEKDVLQTYDHVKETLPELVQRLRDGYVLADLPSTAREPVKGSRLAHDTLTPLVRERFEKSDRPGQRARRILESRAVDWAKGHTGPALDEVDLKVVESGAAGMRAWTSDEERLVGVSRHESARRRLIRQRWYGMGAISLLLVVVAGLFAALQWRHAERSIEEALLSQSQVLALLAKAEADVGSPAIAVRVALAALPRNLVRPDRPYLPQAEDALFHSIEKLRELRRFVGQTAAFSPDGRSLVTTSEDKAARLWDVATGKQLAVLRHNESVRAAVVSPEGRSVVTTCEDKTARLWDVATGKQLAVFRHDDSGLPAVLSPDGRTLATSEARTKRLWDVATGKQLAAFRSDESRETPVFSPDGRKVLTVADGGTVRVWDVATARELSVLLKLGLEHEGSSPEFSPDGRKVLAVASDGTVRVWDVATAREINVLKLESPGIGADFSPDGRKVLIIAEDGTVRVWDVATATELGVVEHEFTVHYAGFSQDGALIVTLTLVGANALSYGRRDDTARVWDGASGRQVAVLRHEHKVFAAAFSPDSRTLVTTSLDGTVRLWDVVPGTLRNDLVGHDNFVTSAAFSPDSRSLVTTSGDKAVRLWDVASGQELSVLNIDARVLASAFSPNGRPFVVLTAEDKTARLLDVVSGKQLAVFRHKENVRTADLSPDGRSLVTTCDDKMARLWDVASGKQLAVFRHDGSGLPAVLSPDGRTLVTVSGDKTVRLYDVASGDQLMALTSKGPVTASAFSSDGRLLLIASSTFYSVQVWEVASGRMINELSVPVGHQVISARFSPDGRRVATASWKDNKIYLWEVNSGQRVAVLENNLNFAVFSPDGRTLLISPDGKTVRLQPLRQSLIDTACARVHELPLSEEQQKRFGIKDEWCTPEVSRGLRAKLGTDKDPTGRGE